MFLALPLLAGAAPAAAQTRNGVLVELFSSSACDSCGSAHLLIGELARRNDVIVVTFPVDYWNYLDPVDELARPEFTARQRAYSRNFGRRNVYTPQIVVHGAVEATGGERARVVDGIATARDRAGPAVTFKLREGALAVTVGTDGRSRSPAQVWLARFAPGPAEGVEPAPYHNAVTSLEKLGAWAGSSTTFSTVPCLEACAVIVQDGVGRVLSAAAWTAPNREVARESRASASP
jgi:hypothetical protein